MKSDPARGVSVMTHVELRRHAENLSAKEWFMFHGLRVETWRWFKHGDPMLVLYRDGVEVGQVGEHDNLVIDDEGRAHAVAHDAFHAAYERDPEWKGGPVGKHRREA